MIDRVATDYLDDMLRALQEIEVFVQNVSFEQFTADRKTVNAVIRSIEVIGEAARNMPVEIQAKYPVIPWNMLVGMRNKLIHGYFGVNLETVWKTIQEDLPLLVPHVQKALEEVRAVESLN